jgi:hypothetical protein
MEQGIRLKPMSKDLFRASTYQAGLKAQPIGASIDEMVSQLDSDNYWNDKPRSLHQKREYVRRKMQTMRDEDGRRIFYRFRGGKIALPRLA